MFGACSPAQAAYSILRNFMQRGAEQSILLRGVCPNIHLVSILCCFHHPHRSISHPCIPSFVAPSPKNPKQLTSTQAENVIAGRPAKHEMSGGIRLPYNPCIFKPGWLVGENVVIITCSKYSLKSMFFWFR